MFWAATLSALTLFALGLAWLWELPHYASLAGGLSGADRGWAFGALWAKSLLPVGVAAALAVPPFGFARWRWGRVAFCSATVAGSAWLVTDLWTQLRYGAEAASYWPFVAAAARAGAATRHWQWMGDPLREIASLAIWVALAALAIGVLWVVATRVWDRAAKRWALPGGRWRAAIVVWGWLAAIAGAAFGVNRIEPPSTRESLVFHLPAPFATPARFFLSRPAPAPCEQPVLVGVVAESWQGVHLPEVVVENRCGTPLELRGWTIATPGGAQGFTPESIAPGSQETSVLAEGALDRWAATPSWVELRSPSGVVTGRVEFVPRDIKRGELVQAPGSEAQSLNRVRLAALEGYGDYFAALRDPLQPEVVSAAEGRPPNVLVIVLDSFRADIAGDALMPGLDRWARRGVRGTRHYSGSNSSHLGLFTLLYGRSALAYDAILDRAPEDGAPGFFRALGYRTSFLSSGGIEAWKRMDDYLNEELFDEVSVFHPASEASWHEWPANDRRVLAAARERIEGADQPVFVLTFLMSLHFPYPYDRRYERFLPVSHEVEGGTWRELFRARLDRERLWNRYRNSAIGADAMLAAFLATVDLDDTIVVITGDHGESFGEDGTLVHGSRGSDAQTRVPLIVLGPGVPARALDRVTGHVDVLPTILNLVSGADTGSSRFEGRDLLRAQGDHPVLLRLYRLEEPTPLLVVRRRGRLLLRARTDAPEIDVLGVVDDRGFLIDTPPDFSDGEWSLALRQALQRGASAARPGAAAP